MAMLLSIFIASTSLVLFLAHYFVFYSLIKFFGLRHPTDQWTLGVILFVLAVSFIVSLFINHWRENKFTRALYYLSGLWLGLLSNLVLGFAAVWLMLILFRFVNFDTDGTGLGRTAILLAIGYSIWGIWNASTFVVKKITVTIPKLPEAWRGKKIVQLSDVHLGLTNREDFMEKIAVRVNAEKPDLVVITGDLFDGMDGDLTAFAAPINDIQSEQGIYFVRGNHEIYVGLKEVHAALEKTTVQVLHDEVRDIDGLKLIGIDYPEDRHDEKVVEILQKLQTDYIDRPNVLLYHVPSNIKQIKKMGVNLELCGHTHKGQIFPFGLLTKLIFRGFDYGLHTDGIYTLYTTSGTGSWGPPMRTEGRSEIVLITLR